MFARTRPCDTAQTKRQQRPLRQAYLRIEHDRFQITRTTKATLTEKAIRTCQLATKIRRKPAAPRTLRLPIFNCLTLGYNQEKDTIPHAGLDADSPGVKSAGLVRPRKLAALQQQHDTPMLLLHRKPDAPAAAICSPEGTYVSAPWRTPADKEGASCGYAPRR